MTDSFARRLHDRPWSVQEASPEARVEYFAPVRAPGSRCVVDVQKSIGRKKA